jgi:hypothetical protein
MGESSAARRGWAMETSDGARLLRTLASLDATGVSTLYAFLEATDVEAIAAAVGKGFLAGANGFDERLAERIQALRGEPHARLVLRVLNRVAHTLSVLPRRYTTEQDLADLCGEIVREACRRLQTLEHDFDAERLDGLVAAHRSRLGDTDGASVRRLVRAFIAQLPEAQRRVLGLGVGAGDVVSLVLNPLGPLGAVMQVGGTAYNAYVHYEPLRQRIAIVTVALAAHAPAGVRDVDPAVTIERVLRMCGEAERDCRRAEHEVALATTRLTEDQASLAAVTAASGATQASRQDAARRLAERRAALAEHARARADAIAEGQWGPALIAAGQALRTSRDQLRQCEQERPGPQTGFLARVAGSAKQWVEIALAQQAIQKHAEAVVDVVEANDWLRGAPPLDPDSRDSVVAAAAEADACRALDREIERLAAEGARLRQQIGDTTALVSRARAARAEVERRYLEIQPPTLAAVLA